MWVSSIKSTSVVLNLRSGVDNFNNSSIQTLYSNRNKEKQKIVSNEIVMGITKHSWKHFKHLQQELTKFKQSKKQTKKAKIKNKTKQRNMRVETGQ